MTPPDADTTPAPPAETNAAAAPAPLLVTASPHIRTPESIPRIMWTVSAALLPAAAWGVYVFGPRALLVMALGIAAALATEAACQAVRKRPITLRDGSAFLTGLLVAFVLPVHVRWYVPVTASFFAIAVAKQAFGGLGCNIWNPALMGRAFVLAAWAALVTVGGGWPKAFHHLEKARTVDAVTAATPLTKVKEALNAANKAAGRDPDAPKSRYQAEQALRKLRAAHRTPLRNLVLGTTGGCIGEVSAVALLIGGVLLIVQGYVKWQVPVFYIATVALVGWLLPFSVRGQQARYLVWFAGDPLFEVFAGGLFLGAFFMATDMVTSPVTRRGLVLFAIGCGVLTMMIRRYGGYPEGVCYAILLMNTARPLIDRHTKPKTFGRRGKNT